MSRDASPLRGRVAFLVGVRRSGTNWLRRIVDAHPDASVIPAETYLLSHGIAPLRERVRHGLAGSARTGSLHVDRDEFLDAVRDLCDRLLTGHLDTVDHPVRVLGERTPDHVRCLDLVADVYPDAAVVHIVRDGRDVARSLVSQTWGPTSYREAAEEWVSGIEAARRHAPRLERYLEVRYEDLLADPVGRVPELYRFLGLDAGDELVRRALAEAEVPYNVDPASAGVSAAKWRGGLAPADLREVLDVAGPLLADLGFDTSAPARHEAPAGPRGARARARQLARDALGRLRPDAPVERALLDRLDTSMGRVEALFEDLASGQLGDLERHFGPRARVRVVRGPCSWDGRGPGAVQRLAGELASDPVVVGRQVRGDVHPGVPGFTVVGTWEHGGAHHDRVAVVTCFGDRVSELTWYVLPRVADRDGGAR